LGINAGQTQAINADTVTLQQSKNKENEMRLHINEHEGNALK